jgi:CTP synthase
VDSEDLSAKNGMKHLKGIDGILVPGGFGYRGIEGKIKAIQYARENKIPFFGICLGMQTAVIEFARNVCNYKQANSTEFNKKTKYPVISLLEEQKAVKDKGGTMRLGGYRCKIKKKTKSFSVYKKGDIIERHRHRYEFNNKYKKAMEKKGLIFSGIHPNGGLVEIVELKDHPWFVACQFHPEFQSKPDKCHPLFEGFVKEAKKTSKKK